MLEVNLVEDGEVRDTSILECPECKGELESGDGDIVICKKCKLQWCYTDLGLGDYF